MTVLEGFKSANLDPGVGSLYYNDSLGHWRTWDSILGFVCEETHPFTIRLQWQALPECMQELEGEYNMGNMPILDCLSILPSEVLRQIPDPEDDEDAIRLGLCK